MSDSVLDFGGKPPQLITHSHLQIRPAERATRIDASSKKTRSLALLDPDTLDNTRSQLYSAIDAILNDVPLTYSYIHYYQMVESLCRFKHVELTGLGDKLYEKIREKYVSIKETLLQSLQESSVSLFLLTFNDYNAKLVLLSKIFLYIDRIYFLLHQIKVQILQYGLKFFIDDFFNGEPSVELLNLHKTTINKARISEDSEDVEIASKLSKLLWKLDNDHVLKLHHDLISQITIHYLEIKSNWCDDPSTHFSTILHKISYEVTYWKDCGYSKKFLYDLLIKLKWNLLFFDFQLIIENSLPFIIESDQELTIMIKYCQLSEEEYNFNSLKIFAQTWGQYLIKIFKTHFNDLKQKNQSKLIKSIVEMYTKYKNMTELKFSLKSDCPFEYGFRMAFNQVINEDDLQDTIHQMLIKQCDGFFKKKNDISFNLLKTQVEILFKSMNKKQEFISLYQRDLSRRLLMSKLSKVEEEEMVKMLLDIIGENDITTSISHMFNDLQLSHHFESIFDQSRLDEMTFNPLILEKKHWPDIPKMSTSEVILPKALQACLDQFVLTFDQHQPKNKHKHLDWTNYGLHQLTIEAKFNSGIKQLILNLYQALVVLLFEEKNEYTLQEIVKSTGLDRSSSSRVISSLIKSKILFQINNDVADDTYQFNYALLEKSQSIKVTFPKDKEKQAIKQITPRIRTEEVQAKILKIMKREKNMSTIELLNECFNQLEKRGPITIQVIKINVEKLIENEYIKRADAETMEYVP